jgi:hypothetical protein
MAVAGHALDICFAQTLLYSLSIIRPRRATACSLLSTLSTSVSVDHEDFEIRLMDNNYVKHLRTWTILSETINKLRFSRVMDR